MAADHHVDGVAHAPDDVDDGPGDAGALVDAAGSRPALVKEDDDGFDALLLQLGNQRVHGVGLVAELEAAHASRGDHRGRGLEGHADEGHLDAFEGAHRVGREQRLAGAPVDHVRGEEAELGAAEAVAVRAAVRRVAAAPAHPAQLGRALVELVVPDGAQIQTKGVHGLDRGLVVEQRRQQRAGADQVAGRHHHRVGVGRFPRADMRREVLDAPGGGPLDLARGAGGRLEMTVEVVDGQHLDVNGSIGAGQRATDEQGGKSEGGDRSGQPAQRRA